MVLALIPVLAAALAAGATGTAGAPDAAAGEKRAGETRAAAREPGATGEKGVATGETGTAARETGTASGGLRFVDAADAWGIDFRHRHGGQGEFYMIETVGSGVVAFDYDGDGDDDLLFVDSGEPAPHGGTPGRTTLLRNDLGPDGPRFVDATEASGILLDGYGMGAVTGDVDGDGDPDVYLTAFGPNRLWLNLGDGAFSPAPGDGGAADPSWSASAAFGDVDLDGDLDLYVTNYVDFSYDNNVLCGQPERGVRSYCHPDVYNPLADRFYRNDSRETDPPLFVDATGELGFGDARGAGLGVVITDFDDDRRPDIYVANDMDPNLYFVNRSTSEGLRFEDDALLAGTALSDRGEPEAGMGIAVGDTDGNGFEDLIVTHLDRQTNALYANQGDRLFLEQRFVAGIAEPSMPWVGFGADLADFDLDGDLDLAVANGHVIHNISEHEGFGAATYAQPNQVFENLGGRFAEVESSGVSAVRVSRGLATADFDLDGDLDLVVSNCNDRAEAYRNESSRHGAALQVDLFDRGSPNRRAIGAVIEVRSTAGNQRREVRAGSSYLSQNSLTQTFGVPASGAASGDREAESPTDSVEIRIHWPRQGGIRLPGLPPGHRVRIVR